MADNKIKKVSIPISSFVTSSVIPTPPTSATMPDYQNASSSGYMFRFRVTSEDGTKTSSWSPKYLVKISGANNTIKALYNTISGTPTVFKNQVISNGSSISISWQIPSNFFNTNFDIYTRWSSAVSTSLSITNKVVSSGVATLTTGATSHGYAAGDYISVIGVDKVLDGVYQVTAVTSTTFSYATTSANTSSIAVSTAASKVVKITWGYWNYITTTGSNNYNTNIPSTSVSTLPNTNFVQVYVQVESNPKTIQYASPTSTYSGATAIFNSTSEIFNTAISTYSTPTDSGKLV